MKIKNKDYLTSKQVADMLGYRNIRSFYNAVRAGRITKPAMVLGRYWLFNPEDFK